MKCEQCGGYHRYFVPCDALPKERRVLAMCDFCTSLNTPWSRLERVRGHPEERVDWDHGDSRQDCAVAKCPKCGTTWIMRYQWDVGTGSDNEVWVHEVGKGG